MRVQIDEPPLRASNYLLVRVDGRRSGSPVRP